ncbi:hypothetical protein [Vreelandella sulfidaeris]
MEDKQVLLELNQVMYGLLKGAWLELILVVDHHYGVFDRNYKP